MYRTLLSLASLSIFSFHAICQQTPPVTGPTGNPDSKIFSTVEVEADFPGGVAAWIQYLQKNLNPNVPVKKKARAGTYTVIIRFVVARDGSISDIAPETAHGHGMEEEVMRIIKKGPKWNPAQQNGQFVNAYRRQPVTFVVRGR